MTATFWSFTKGAEKEYFLIRHLDSCLTSLASVGFHIFEGTRNDKLVSYSPHAVLQDSHGLRTKQEMGIFTFYHRFCVGPLIRELSLNLLRCADSLTLRLVLKQFPKLQLPTMHTQKTTEKQSIAYILPLNCQASATVTISSIG